ncbi:23S rRNA m(5)U-1939 methyltransferase [Rhodovulum imhoffii]|uniref:23S rRNA m(5)U-1939 methyltransferase n=1 Tax=Rhodovulum imhoffii TaxID=365340 RepID=A0A2T5BRQ1_9RHOB|nr:class I SAM-dependent RNA methyltransferase [Rhodovulum imhoffii]MBK5934009.1 RNA methyltransferase [Rhodovulum imhoffii]PTN01894.1 23S rRNA m(5)U-1939 methyltransferase [Rhodovulum imhoffii]
MNVKIERLSLRGEGLSAEGLTVPRSLPGEVVEGAVDAGRIHRARVITPSPDRVRPPCPHFRACGGCALQHASDAFVADWKTQVVARALSGQGLEAPVSLVHTSHARARRRAVLAGRRTKKGVMVGFHGRASDMIVAVPGCTLLHPDLVGCLPALEDLTAEGASRRGEVAFTLTLSGAGVDVAVKGAREGEFGRLAALADRHDLARLTWNGELVATRREPAQRLGRAQVVPPGGAFLQATAGGQSALTGLVLEALGTPARVVDLFAGVGTFTLPVAGRAEVHAVEGDALMLAALERGWRQAQGLRRVTVEPRDLFRRPLTPDELAGFDVAVLDPPRPGAEAQVDRIAASRLARVVMVSCNPVSFARDARRLVEGGFALGAVSAVDQFRWSAHVELAACFTRDHIG